MATENLIKRLMKRGYASVANVYATETLFEMLVERLRGHVIFTQDDRQTTYILA